MFDTSFTETKRNFTPSKAVRNKTKFRLEIFRNFFVVTHLCHRLPSKIHVTMVNVPSVLGVFNTARV